MSLYNRRKFILSLGGVSALTACGFSPVYGPNGAGQQLYGTVKISAPNSRDGYLLAAGLTETLGAPTAVKFLLDTKLSVEEKPIGITRDLEIQRYHVIGTADYVLTEAATGARLLAGSVDSFTAYSATESTIDALTTPRDARKRLMKILSDLMVAELTAKLGADA